MVNVINGWYEPLWGLCSVKVKYWFESLIFFFKQKTAYEMLRSLVGSEMCIRDRRAKARAIQRRTKKHGVDGSAWGTEGGSTGPLQAQEITIYLIAVSSIFLCPRAQFLSKFRISQPANVFNPAMLRHCHEGTRLEMLDRNAASATLVDRFALHDKPGAVQTGAVQTGTVETLMH